MAPTAEERVPHVSRAIVGLAAVLKDCEPRKLLLERLETYPDDGHESGGIKILKTVLDLDWQPKGKIPVISAAGSEKVRRLVGELFGCVDRPLRDDDESLVGSGMIHSDLNFLTSVWPSLVFESILQGRVNECLSYGAGPKFEPAGDDLDADAKKSHAATIEKEQRIRRSVVARCLWEASGWACGNLVDGAKDPDTWALKCFRLVVFGRCLKLVGVADRIGQLELTSTAEQRAADLLRLAIEGDSQALQARTLRMSQALGTDDLRNALSGVRSIFNRIAGLPDGMLLNWPTRQNRKLRTPAFTLWELEEGIPRACERIAEETKDCGQWRHEENLANCQVEETAAIPTMPLGDAAAFLGLRLDEKTRSLFREGFDLPAVFSGRPEQWPALRKLVLAGEKGLNASQRREIEDKSADAWRQVKGNLNNSLGPIGICITAGRIWRLENAPEA